MAPLSGTDPRHLGGFRVLTLLAVGGMGRVYLALGPDRRAVALKVARPEIAADARFRARFRREVATAREVGGDGGSLIAPVVAADADAELPWLASEYVPGPSVTDAAMEFGPLGEAGLRTLTHGLALALTEVHAAGVVHRDVKPSNVLLARDGPRLIDFGVARAIDDVSLTRVGALIGSPGFLSPEQAVGDTATFSSDVFAMASVVAYAARGQSPFGAGDGPALLYRVVHEPPKLEGIPGDLAEVLAACLAKDPAERPTAPEIAALVDPAEAWLPEPVLDDIARREAELNAWLEVTAADPLWVRAAAEAEQKAAGFDSVADSALDIANARRAERWHAGTRRREPELTGESPSDHREPEPTRESPSDHLHPPDLPRPSAAQAGAPTASAARLSSPELNLPRFSTAKAGAAYTAFLLSSQSEPDQRTELDLRSESGRRSEPGRRPESDWQSESDRRSEPGRRSEPDRSSEPDPKPSSASPATHHRAPHRRRRFPLYAALGALLGAAAAAAVLLVPHGGRGGHGAPSPSQGPVSTSSPEGTAKAASPTTVGGRSGPGERSGPTSASGSRR